MSKIKLFEEFINKQIVKKNQLTKKTELSDTVVNRKGKLSKKVIHIKNWNQY